MVFLALIPAGEGHYGPLNSAETNLSDKPFYLFIRGSGGVDSWKKVPKNVVALVSPLYTGRPQTVAFRS